MQFIDEKNNLAGGIGHFLQHRLEPILELAAKLGAGNQCAQVQGHQPFFFQAFRHVTVDDAQREPFHNGRLADAGLADENGIVLGSPRQNLDDAANFIVPANDRVEFSLAGQLRQVAAILFQGLILFLRVGIGNSLPAANADQRVQDLVTRGSEFS